MRTTFRRGLLVFEESRRLSPPPAGRKALAAFVAELERVDTSNRIRQLAESGLHAWRSLHRYDADSRGEVRRLIRKDLLGALKSARNAWREGDTRGRDAGIERAAHAVTRLMLEYQRPHALAATKARSNAGRATAAVKRAEHEAVALLALLLLGEGARREKLYISIQECGYDGDRTTIGRILARIGI